VKRREYIARNFNPLTREYGNPITEDQMRLFFAQTHGLNPDEVEFSPGRNKMEYSVEYPIKYP
jgi:hypothetical protein